MRLKRIVLLGCCLTLTTLMSISAQNNGTGTEGVSAVTVDEAPQKLSLTLDGAKDYAVSYNRTLRSSDLSVQKAQKAKWQSIASMLPHVDGTLGYNNLMGYEMEFGGMSIKMPSTGDLTLTASLAVNGMMIVGVQLNQMAIEMSELNKDITEQDVKANVTTGYLSVLIAEESKRLIEGSLDNVKKLYESTAKMYDVGMAEQTDVDQLSVQVGTLENNIRLVERNVELAYNSLRLLLGSNEAEIELQETLDDFLKGNDVFETMTMPFDLDENNNVKLLNKNVELSKKQETLQKWEYGPTLSGYYQYYTRTTFGADEGFNMNPPNTVGLKLAIPIFSSGERLSKVQQAKFDRISAELSREDAIEGLKVQEKQLRFNLKSAIETYEVQKKNVEVYDRIFENTSQKYKLGTVSSTELTTINNNLISAQSSYISALMEMFNAQTELLKLLNQL